MKTNINKLLRPKPEVKEHWASKTGFVLAAIGSAVGLGNIWRFPYAVSENGGGAFLIPYIIGVLFFAMPLMMLEFGVGKRFKLSILESLKKINPRIKWLGYIPLLLSVGVLSYYIVVACWTFAYFFFSFSKEYVAFGDFTGSLLPILFFVMSVAMITYIIKAGVKKGIETTCKVLIPLLFVFLLILIVRAVTLPGAVEGLRYYLFPDFSLLKLPRIWLFGIAQAFFSMSVGFGVLLTYGSYISDKKESVQRDALKVAAADTLVAVLAGFVVFPTIFAFGIAPAQGPKLAFIAFPQVFDQMFAGHIFGAIFFLLLFIGALTSAISLLEIIVANFMQEMNWNRSRSTLVAGFIVLLLGIPSALSYSKFGFTIFGRPFLDVMDHIFASFLTPFSAAVLAITIAWFWKKEELLKSLDGSGLLKVPRAAVWWLRIVVPALLIILIIIELL